MGFSLHLKKNSSKKQSGARTANKEPSPLHQFSNHPCPKDPDKLKAKKISSGVVPPQCNDPDHKSVKDVSKKIANRNKSSKGSSRTNSDELVKYMSNLPGYLQRSADRGENLQEKALNFGVLDWSRLEKWKNREMHVPALYSSFAKFNTGEASSSRVAPGTSSNIAGAGRKLDDNKKRLDSSGSKAPHKEVFPESSNVSSVEFESFRKKTHQKEWRTESLASKSRNHNGVSLGSNSNLNYGRDVNFEAKKSLEGIQQQQHILRTKERIHKPSSPRRQTSLRLKNKGVSFSSQKKMMDQFQTLDADGDGHRKFNSKPSNIVLLRPRRVQQFNSSTAGYYELSKLRSSHDDDDSESSHSSLFTFLPEEVSEELCSEIRHSSTLTSVTDEPSTSSERMQHIADSDSDVDSHPGDIFLLKDVLNIKLENGQETAEVADQNSQNSSPNYKLSLSFDQMRRSFSLKEQDLPPQLSAKSGPLTTESLENSMKEKEKGHKRTRSTPFLKLFDPLLKHNASNTQHSNESSLAAQASAGLNPFANKSKGSSIQAILQLTIKNGLPLFKFLLNNERKVLAATMKSLASPEKDDAGFCFSFYLVNEIKKKSGGWRSHVSKDKSCGYVYNMVGQMKFSSRKIDQRGNQNSKRQCMVKEYVLFGVEIDNADQKASKLSKRKELAAIVMEIPCENSSREGLHDYDLMKKGCLKCLEDQRCFCISGERDVCGNITAILPGGVHSEPTKGEPSPLIYRWKSGGTCDCGGWDVGCKLLVISNKNPSSNVPRTSKPQHERFQLFVQEGADPSTPLFTLAPLKDGFYSVEFSSTIDHLQAFFISVAVLSSQKLPTFLEMSNMHDDIKYELQGKASINYNPIPPVSPVGRV
ncbi:uncharacterized protein LOC107636623 [Arachis ipaensis]|uniref:uncharacterized protein LOC107636623 n=1 Tax=Arachis ipaensis TaxID=130454 RepID=UPI0007AF2EF4|nr:uncharacterized protein LOC107636623 [Arachis ipaensis]